MPSKPRYGIIFGMDNRAADVLVEYVESFDLDAPLPTVGEAMEEIRRCGEEASEEDVEAFLAKYAETWQLNRK